jgi:pyridoxamine 5'-phosphate oxidase
MIQTDNSANPIDKFNIWFQEAAAEEINDPNAGALATVDALGRPSVRMVLLKGICDGCFVFYTNLESRKGQQLKRNPYVSLCFYWKSVRRQIRIEGKATQVSDAEADAYFATRPVGAQIGAWASKQSSPLSDRSELEEALAKYALQFGDNPVPRPSYWSGFKIEPNYIEFWQEQPFRLHDRLAYVRDETGWQQMQLYP